MTETTNPILEDLTTPELRAVIWQLTWGREDYGPRGTDSALEKLKAELERREAGDGG